MNVTHATCDDWAALYLDGRQVGEQNHSLDIRNVLEDIRATGKPITSVESLEVSYEWMETQGHFPPNLGDIPTEVRL